MKVTYILVLLLALTACSQSRRTDCYGIPELKKFNTLQYLPDDLTHDTLSISKTDMRRYLERSGELKQKPLPLLPMIAMQLSDYRPTCNKKKDAGEYALLVSMYNDIRNQSHSTDFTKREETIYSIIEDFKELADKKDHQYLKLWGHRKETFSRDGVLSFEYNHDSLSQQ